MLSVVGKWLLGGGLSGIMRELRGAYADKRNATNEGERIAADERVAALREEADVVQAYYASRASWMQAGGFWLLLMFAVPVGVWFGAVTLYNLLWCSGCAYPQEWTIAAYPAPIDEWAGWIVLACIGGAGAFAWKK